jgi:hypothetical protein
MSPPCPLCSFKQTSLIHTGGKGTGRRDFFHCRLCDLIFVPDRFFLTLEEEKNRYLEHNNDPYDEDYRDFLRRLYLPLKPHLRPGSVGLDYGAGPGPALATMMKEDGFDVRMYDPFFHPDEASLSDTYDFITCMETVEHFREPATEFQYLQKMLRHGGWLGMMTSMLDDWSEFPSWYYHRDPTHVCFYSRKTMQWVGRQHSWKTHFPAQNVTLFHKP